MRLLRRLRNHPFVLLIGLAAGFGTWLVADRLGPDPQPRALDPADGSMVAAAPSATVVDAPQPVAVVPLTALPHLKAGMSRVAVENLLGTPRPDQLGPVVVQDGRVIYQTAYPVDLEPEPVMTLRPMGRRWIPNPPPSKSRPIPETLLTLEFDASRPGHPLVGVQYPDPLF